MFTSMLAIGTKELREIVKPLLDICNATVPVLLAIVGAIGALWCILLGVKYARAEDPQEHEKAKNGLKNAIIGFVLIFVLLIGLQVASSAFENWWSTYEIPQF